MGMWVITIAGTGQHHNKDMRDANEIAEVAVAALKDAGHYIDHASFTSGGRDTLHAAVSTPKEETK